AASARVPGPIGSSRKASSPRGARHSDIGRGRTRPGASSMKNCPGMPGSMPPRSTRTSAYGPTASTATTLRRSRLSLDIDALLERQRVLRTCVRNRVHGRGRAGDGGDARDARAHRRLTDDVAVAAGERAAFGRVDDEIAATPRDQVDDRRLVALDGDAPHAVD